MTLPNFFIIGAPRCGTTSLWRYLDQHPEIFMCPVKEPGYYRADDPSLRPAASVVRDRDRYVALFRAVRNQKAVGEATPMYLGSTTAAAAIRRDVPHARFIVSLRHPVDRAYSAFVGRRREGLEPCATFLDMVNDEERRRNDRTAPPPAFEPGFYGRQLKRWFDAFPLDRFSVHLYEDFTADPAAIVRGLFAFLEVDPDFEPDVTVHHNPSIVVRNPLVRATWARSYWLRRRVRNSIPIQLRDAIGRMTMRGEKPPMPLDLREELLEVFRADILLLQDLLDLDLSRWLEPAGSSTTASGP